MPAQTIEVQVLTKDGVLLNYKIVRRYDWMDHVLWLHTDQKTEDDLRNVLTDFFPDGWRSAKWDFEAEWSGFSLDIDFIGLTVDGVLYPDTDNDDGTQDFEAALYKAIKNRVDIYYLAREGITELLYDSRD